MAPLLATDFATALAAFERLPAGWDGRDAEPISRNVTRHVLALVASVETPLERLGLSSENGVELAWRDASAMCYGTYIETWRAAPAGERSHYTGHTGRSCVQKAALALNRLCAAQ